MAGYNYTKISFCNNFERNQSLYIVFDTELYLDTSLLHIDRWNYLLPFMLSNEGGEKL